MISQKRFDHGLWWEKTWRLTAGCTKLSPGCENCWAEREAATRTQHPDPLVAAQYSANFTGGAVEFIPQNLSKPLAQHKAAAWAIWNDLFHPAVTEPRIAAAFDIIRRCPQHTFILCTKRPERAAAYTPNWTPPENLILMATVEDQARTPRIMDLYNSGLPRPNLALSIEPLLGPVTIHSSFLSGIGTVIIGCESGAHRRACAIEWIRDIIAQCDAVRTNVFVKQIPSQNPDAPGPSIRKDITTFPADLQRRELAWR